VGSGVATPEKFFEIASKFLHFGALYTINRKKMNRKINNSRNGDPAVKTPKGTAFPCVPPHLHPWYI
jgi:hypothetical protein